MNSQTSLNRHTTKWAALAALAVTLLAIYPQVNLWIARGKDWSGSYVLVQGDEIAYSAYINALIDGRPRRNDPFTGKDDVPGAPLPESLFSIQVVPSYAVALPARLLHITASTAFICLIVASAITSSLSIFWLLNFYVRDGMVAAVGTLLVLCLGTLAAWQGEARTMLTGQYVYDFFPFLRRYQPAISFPLFFLFCVLVSHSLVAARIRKRITWSVFSGVIFGIIVFSYFYMWTAALAWLVCMLGVWLIARPTEWKSLLLTSAIVSGMAALEVVAFFSLLAQRSQSMDSTQLLLHSRAPDLFYAPELIALLVLVAIAVAATRKVIDLKEPIVLVAISSALLPLAVFNQQVITGLSLQPIHYQVFIANYVVLLALVLAVVAILRGNRGVEWQLPRKALVYAGCFALAWGVVELAGSTRRNAAYARLRDDSMKVITRLDQIARADGTLDRARTTGSYPIVYSTNIMVAGNIPTGAPQGVLWAHHTPAAGVASLARNKELYYYYLYYSGADEKSLAQAMLDGEFNTLSSLFGIERVITTLSPTANPITREEMRAELINYSDFIKTFSKDRAAAPLLSFVVAPVEAEPSYANLDRWYERDAGERVGIYVIYRVKLRS